jgi:[ribosomal protein S18]-alanine N-acetyltransferase
VRTGSVGAVALYRSLGFVGVGERVGYYRDPVEDALLMQLRLAEGS